MPGSHNRTDDHISYFLLKKLNRRMICMVSWSLWCVLYLCNVVLQVSAKELTFYWESSALWRLRHTIVHHLFISSGDALQISHEKQVSSVPTFLQLSLTTRCLLISSILCIHYEIISIDGLVKVDSKGGNLHCYWANK